MNTKDYKKYLENVSNKEWIFLAIGFVAGMLWKMLFIIAIVVGIVYLIYYASNKKKHGKKD